MTALGAGGGLRVFICFAAGFFMSYSLRAVNAVIAPELVAQFQLDSAQLGAMSAAYFFSFALMQLPLGVWLDRYGARRTDATLLLVAAIGCATFASAHTASVLWVGRALIGAGVSGALMSALKGYRYWYSPQRQQPLTAWMLVVGTSGAMVATVPVQALMPIVGWRGVFWIAAVMLVASAAAIWFLVPRDEEGGARERSSLAAVLSGYVEVFADRYFWRFGLVGVTVQGGFIAMQTLWAGPWFTQVLGLTPGEAARALFMFNLVLLGAYLALGAALPPLARRGWTMLRLVAVATAFVLALQLAIALLDGAWTWLLWLAFAIGSTVHTVAQPHVCTTFPAALTGRAYTAYNLLIFGGIFLCQWLFGVAIELFRGAGFDEPQAYRATMLGWVAIQSVPFAILLWWRVPPRDAAGEPAP